MQEELNEIGVCDKFERSTVYSNNTSIKSINTNKAEELLNAVYGEIE